MSVDHPQWRAMCKVLERARNAGVSLCINKKDRIWITLDRIELEPSGCGCGAKYQRLFLVGTASRTRRPHGWRSRPMYINVGQYEMHQCRNDGEAGSNEPVFRCDLGRGWECYHVYVDVHDLRRQVDASTKKNKS